jgi:hypothetical protein
MRISNIDCSMYRAQALGAWGQLSKAPGFTSGLWGGGCPSAVFGQARDVLWIVRWVGQVV